MTTVNANVSGQSAIQQPQIIILKEEKESLVSRELRKALGPFVLKAGVTGLIVGGFAAVLDGHTYPALTAVVTGAITTAVATAGVHSLQKASDFGVNAVFFAVKLPFRAAEALLSGAAHGIQCAYNAINSNQTQESTPAKEIILDSKLA